MLWLFYDVLEKFPEIGFANFGPNGAFYYDFLYHINELLTILFYVKSHKRRLKNSPQNIQSINYDE